MAYFTGSQNPYFSIQNPYGGNWNGQFPDTVVGGEYLNTTNPRAAFTRYTAPWGGGMDRYSQFVQSQYTPLRQAYEAAVATNPMLQWTDFLGATNPAAFQQQWNRLGPAGRGENWMNAGGNARWTRLG